MQKNNLIILLIITAVSCLLNCSPDNYIVEFKGTVYDASGDSLVPNVPIVIHLPSETGWWRHYEEEITKTNENGFFSGEYDIEGRTNGISLYVNYGDNRLDKYSTEQYFGLTPEKPFNENVILYQSTSLVVTAEINFEVDYAIIYMPEIGLSTLDGTLTLNCVNAKANLVNEVMVQYYINGNEHQVSDYVYCPIDTVTYYNFVLTEKP